MSEYHLSVVTPFAEHARGDRITDPDKIDAIMATEQAQHVVRVAAPVEEVAALPTPVAEEHAE